MTTIKIDFKKMPVETIVERYMDAGYKSRKYILRIMRKDGLLSTDGKCKLTRNGIHAFFVIWEAHFSGVSN